MTQPRVAASPAELLEFLAGSARVDGERLVIDDEAALPGSRHPRRRLDRDLQRGRATVEAARWIVWEASQLLDAPSASIHDLYLARGRGEVHGFTVPAINLRTQVFDMALTICHTAQKLDVGTVIFELARSEQEYTFQRPGEYITSVLAGCVAAGWQGPVFVQGDHYQFNAKKYAADPESVTQTLRKADRATRSAWATATSTSTAPRWSIFRSPRSTISSARTTSGPPSSRRSSARSSRTA